MIKHLRLHITSLAAVAFLIGAISLVILPGLSSAKAAPGRAQISIGVRVNLEPPPLPVYEQPPCPDPDYIWTPGYWAWDGEDYYWVPGTWVEAPDPGLLWTPGYWAWQDGAYAFVPGYWGPTVGFYGGIDYGFGYDGRGYVGGRWNRGHFYYNSAVNNVNVTVVHNTYVDRNVVVNNNRNRASFNGGNGGVNARATAQQQAAANARHVGPVSAQTRQEQSARNDQQLHSSYNHGAPPVAATSRPGNFSGNGVVPARNAAMTNQPANRAANQPSNSPENRGNTPANQPRQPAQPNSRQQMERQPTPNRPPAAQNSAPQQTPQIEQRRQQQQQTPSTQTQRPQQQHPQARPAPQMQPQSQPRHAPHQQAAPPQPQRTQPQPRQQRQQAPQQRAEPQQRTEPQQRAQPQQPREDKGDQHDQH